MTLAHPFAQDLQFDAQHAIWLPRTHAHDFIYTDGNDTEKSLCALFDQTEDLTPQSASLQACIRDWPTQYHLSLARSHLLRPIAHLFANKVLEIGSGCGAITRYLTDIAKHVTAIEGSTQRAIATRKRCRGIDNVDVICRNIMDMNFQTTFDAITLVGVLEYSPKYIQAVDPVQALLKKCGGLLKDDGALVVAIENQFGLKYFAGADEDHIGQPFYGIDQNYRPADVVTFGRIELQRRLQQAGFADVTFLYPFPDYKLPTAVFTESDIHRHGNFLDNLASRLGAEAQTHDYVRLFSEEMALNKLAENRILSELANSFLVVARRHATQPVVKPTIQVHLYPQASTPSFAKEIILSTDPNDAVHIHRRHLFKASLDKSPPMQQRLCNKPWLQGKLYARLCHQIINHPGWTTRQIAAWASPWIAYLKQQTFAKTTDEALHLQGHLIDCIPFNLIRDDAGQFHTFDLEWEIAQDIPWMWVVLRGLFHTLRICKSTALPQDAAQDGIMAIVQQVLQHLGLDLTVEQIDTLWQLEHDFFNADLKQTWQERLSLRQMPTVLRADKTRLAAQLATLAQQKCALEAELKNLQAQHQRLTELVYNQSRACTSTPAALRRQHMRKLARDLESKIPFHHATKHNNWHETLTELVSERRFDIDYYLAHNPDVLEAGCHPLMHFARYGKREQRKHQYIHKA